MSQALSLQQLHKIETDILKVFHDFCEQHHLMYYLFAGTLLGAIRHKGFIPWDDDIDVLMPRPDYQKFIQLFPQYNKHAHLQLASIDNTPNYYVPIIKIYDNRFEIQEPITRTPCPLGPFVDIFPLDNMGDHYEQAVKLYNQIIRWKCLGWWKVAKTSFDSPQHVAREIIRWGLLPISTKFFLKRIDKIAQSYAAKTFTKYVFNVTLSPYPPDKIMISEWFSGRELHDFEGHQFYIPSGWHEILKNFYGDYMTPPPQQQRKIHFHAE